jgi:acetyl esterase
MSTRHLVDPEVAPIIDMFPALDMTLENIADVRSTMVAFSQYPDELTVRPEIVQAKGRDGAPDVPLYVYNPPSQNRSRAAILHIHGGGMVIGSAEMSKMSMPDIALAHEAVAVSVDYRLAPETPFPGPQEDCYAGLDWLVVNAEKLGVDPTRIIVMGESAGGGLAAALALMVRDRGEHKLAGQILIYPMLDHRTGGTNCLYKNPTTGEFIWTASRNQFGWDSLRGNYAVSDDRKGWFSPARAESLAGLPPTFIMTGSLDLFVDEDLDYARRLSADGVLIELHVYPGGIHAFNLAAEARIAQQAGHDLMSAVAQMIGSDANP